MALSQRLEQYRDTEASGMALLSSGNCVELIHTKALNPAPCTLHPAPCTLHPAP